MSGLFEKLDALAATMLVPVGATLFRLDQIVTGAYTVRKGKIALIWTDSDGVTPMDSLGPGSIIGLPAVLNGEYSVSARAVEASELGFVSVSQVLDLLTIDREMLQAVTALLAVEVSRMRDLARHRVVTES